jgi:hypothetical protein
MPSSKNHKGTFYLKTSPDPEESTGQSKNASQAKKPLGNQKGIRYNKRENHLPGVGF